MAELEKNPAARHARGLYAGCGNGRNYLNLVRAGLDVIGLDVSTAGLAQITSKEPSLAGKLACCDFLEYDCGRFGYIVAIQSFQHGDAARTMAYFRKAADMLDAGGLLFVRVNAADTDIGHPHTITESASGGFTVLYEDGPKRGLLIHFFSQEGLEVAVASSGLRMRRPPKKVTTKRAGERGSWSQWEMVAEREV